MTILVVAIGLFGFAAYSDVSARLIPNEIALAIASLGLIRILLVDDRHVAAFTLAASIVVFASGYLLFWHGVFGGGDAKLMAAAALLVGYRDLYRFLLLMSLGGAAIALGLFLRKKQRLRLRLWSHDLTPPAKSSEATLAPSSVPYGVAIAAAGATILILQTSFGW